MYEHGDRDMNKREDEGQGPCSLFYKKKGANFYSC